MNVVLFLGHIVSEVTKIATLPVSSLSPHLTSTYSRENLRTLRLSLVFTKKNLVPNFISYVAETDHPAERPGPWLRVVVYSCGRDFLVKTRLSRSVLRLSEDKVETKSRFEGVNN